MKFNRRTLLIIGASTTLMIAGLVGFSSFDESTSNTDPIVQTVEESNLSLETEFGIPIDPYEIKTGKIERNEFLSTILQRYGVNLAKISEIADVSKPVYDVRKISAGKPYTVFINNEGNADYFVYQPNKVEYVVYKLNDGLEVIIGQKEVETKIRSVTGVINSSLYQALDAQNVNPALANTLAEVYGWTVNFYSIKKGDWFKIMYEQHLVDNEPVSSGRILSAEFGHNGRAYEAYYFQADGEDKGFYYDEKGNSLRRTFLKAPLKYSRISSRYSPRRLHPVTKVWKAHLGTDFAAPHGTPILATADGVVTAATYAGGNGNYVKIQHDNVYATQYLHMSKRAVKRGDRVKQGEVIGYVGSTGLATGPHVCYRFWKNGKQIDPLKMEFPPSEPIKEEYRAAFTRLILTQRTQLARLNPENPNSSHSNIQELFEFNLRKLLATKEGDFNKIAQDESENLLTPMIRSL